MDHRVVAGTLALVLMAGTCPRAQEPAASAELEEHLATLNKQVEDTSLAISQRESLVQEMAGTLDRAAQAADTSRQRRERWSQAVGLLDGFENQNPGHPRAREFALQAAVYRWAQGQTWRDAISLNPGDGQAVDEASRSFDDAIGRLHRIVLENADKALVDNVRFRLAQALADRADLEPAGADAQVARGRSPGTAARAAGRSRPARFRGSAPGRFAAALGETVRSGGLA